MKEKFERLIAVDERTDEQGVVIGDRVRVAIDYARGSV